MKIGNGQKENGIVTGNFYDKYQTKNRIARLMMDQFKKQLFAFMASSHPGTIHEVGCGEGFLTIEIRKRLPAENISVRGSDFSASVIGLAGENARQSGLNPEMFSVRSIYDLTEEDRADLVICCEVLEHLEDPEKGLNALRKIVTGTLILSVPREPLWRILNLARGKYWRELGNTPGHVNHWSKDAFRKLAASYFEVSQTASPLPWTMLLCHPKGN